MGAPKFPQTIDGNSLSLISPDPDKHEYLITFRSDAFVLLNMAMPMCSGECVLWLLLTFTFTPINANESPRLDPFRALALGMTRDSARVWVCD